MTLQGIRLPASVLQSDWFELLAVFVGVNTLIFATLSIFQMLPPLREWFRRE
jgi:hypothetical protein